MTKAAVGIVIAVVAVGGLWYFFDHRSDTVQFDTYGYATNGSGTAGTGAAAEPNAPITSTNTVNVMKATLHTTHGDIVLEFEKGAPHTVQNFVTLAKDGFYNGTKFHRVIAGFMIQGGDPLTKDDAMAARWGTGGPGYTFADEIHGLNRNDTGTIAMANAGPNTNGSQFFINTANNNFLDTKHTVFGKVVAGMDVVKAIGGVQTDANDRPTSPVIINSVTVE
jgi:peptidylprolyl isomerase